MTARDVAYGIARGFLPSVDSAAARLYFGEVEGIDAFASGEAELPSGLRTPDDRTLEIRLRTPTGRLVAEALTLPLAAPVPAEYAAPFDGLPSSTYGRNQVFTGPYRIAAGPGGLLPPAQAARITLDRNPAWDDDEDSRPAFVDRIVLEQRSPSPAALARRVLGGRGAINGDRPAAADLTRALRERPDQIDLPLSGTITFIALNTRLAPFDDPDVRRAVSAAMDQGALRAALGGAAVGDIPTHWIPPGVPGFDEAGGNKGPGFDFLSVESGNLPLARRYLRAAGYPGGRITGAPVLELVASRRPAAARVRRRDPPHARGARAAQSRALPALRPVHRGVLAGSRGRGLPRRRLAARPRRRRLGSPAPVRAEGLQAGTNDFRFSDPEVERLMHEAAETTGEQDRAERWAGVDREVTALAPGVPVVWNREPNLRSADVKGVLDPELAGGTSASRRCGRHERRRAHADEPAAVRRVAARRPAPAAGAAGGVNPGSS